ncbi:Antitoxin VapB2 [Corynebacterium lowii]|uniref:Antitoxin VapB2 n=1 Tax=Corynebacterium lowii TaxID=1544413 RepID=A0A0Q0UJ44_9CORY|nr:Antitoxin VapB2 [Corynebacterium lowii]MDP9850733.1 hypothetical protein [Corynebacterium lowii]
MTNVLTRGLRESTVKGIDTEAAALGLSRNESLRRKLEGDSPEKLRLRRTSIGVAPGKIFADPEVMANAWR